jgi:hypothetical protein
MLRLGSTALKERGIGHGGEEMVTRWCILFLIVRLFEIQKAIVEEITCLQDMALAMEKSEFCNALRPWSAGFEEMGQAKRPGTSVAWWILSAVMEYDALANIYVIIPIL